MPTKTFIYQQTGTSKIFPIDYSGREFSRKTSVNQQKIKTWIMEESPMSKQLKGLVMNNNSEEYERMDNEKGKTPYPVEAMPFLECYVNLIKKDKYSKIFIDPTKTETRKIFLREFCTQICSFLLPDKNEKNAQPTIDCIDQNTFARHTIFGNQTFSREIMDDLWEREFDSRIKTIRERAKNLPYDKQAELLKAYLITMDEWILGFPNLKNAGIIGSQKLNSRIFSKDF